MKTEKEKMIAGEMYLPADPQLSQERLEARLLVKHYNDSSPRDIDFRTRLLEKLFGKIGKNILIEPSFRCDYGWNIEVGKNFFMNFNCVILDVCPVTIGDDFMAAPGVHIYTGTHPVDPVERVSGREFGKPVQIGNKVWLGGGVLVCPGVTIGNNVTIGAGSVVIKDIPSNSVAAGNPCRVLRRLE